MFGLKLIKKSKILENYEEVVVFGNDNKSQKVRAKVDTGANRTSIDQKIAEELGLLDENNIVEKKMFYSGLGQQERHIVVCSYEIKDTKITSEVSISDRSHMTHRMIIGRRDIADFLVKPSKNQEK